MNKPLTLRQRLLKIRIPLIAGSVLLVLGLILALALKPGHKGVAADYVILIGASLILLSHSIAIVTDYWADFFRPTLMIVLLIFSAIFWSMAFSRLWLVDLDIVKMAIAFFAYFASWAFGYVLRFLLPIAKRPIFYGWYKL